MGVVISKPTINIREQLTELKAQQGYEERQFHFDNLVTNGTFDTDVAGWTDDSTNGGAISYSSGAMLLDAGASGDAWGVQSITTTVGQSYTVEVTMSASTGSPNLVIRVGTASRGTQNLNVAHTSAGTYSHTFVATSTTTFISIGQTVDGADSLVDNVSVYEVDPVDDKVIHTMPKGWKPLHVFEDGALQREGAAHDYEVGYDGFDYYVKPAVAPSVTTQTCVIGVKA